MRRLLLEANPYRVRAAVLDDGELRELRVEREDRRGRVGNLYKGRVRRVLPGIDAAFVDLGLERDGYLLSRDFLRDGDADGPRLPAPGDDLVVQVRRDATPRKGARLTRRISLPGRALVWFPHGRGGGVSRRIPEGEARDDLTAWVPRLASLHGGAWVLRTAAAGATLEALESESARLLARYREVLAAAQRAAAPTLLWREEGLLVRALRDRFRDDIEEVLVDGPGTFAAVEELVRAEIPELAGRLRCFEPEGFLFEQSGVEAAQRRLLHPRVDLPGGGHLAIESTEALVAIDVNSGQRVDGHDLAATALATNLEAADEIPRQLRLRDLAGIVVIDFIDLEDAAARQQVEERLAAGLAEDPQGTRMVGFSEFGLVQLTRRHSRGTLARQLAVPCGTCAGRGRVPSALHTLLRVRRDLLHGGGAPRCVRLHPGVLRALEKYHGDLRTELERRWPVPPDWCADPELDREQYRIERPAAEDGR